MQYTKNFGLLFFIALCWFRTAETVAQSDEAKWDVNNPPGNWNDVSFTVDEGTWMNLDVSPDGNTIAFDLLGDIYTMPITGGRATAIRTGIAWCVQPRFSPDGKRILFTSDAGGGDNIWVMDTDGSNARQLTKENFRLLNNPVWMPDGEYFIARKHFTSRRSLGAGEMWMYHHTGGAGMQLTERKNDQQDVNEPSVSPDGRYVYFSEDMYPGGFFQYNKDPNSQIYVIKRYDIEKGETETVISGPGGAFRPQISPDGNTLAFVKRIRTKTVLFTHDLNTGQETPVYTELSKDQQEAWAIFGVYTGFNWTPDNRHIIIWAGGKIMQIEVATGEAVEIPFEAHVNMQVAETIRHRQSAFDAEFDVNVIRHVTAAPVGNNILFNAVGFIWEKSLPDGEPRRVSTATDFEFEPAYAPGGKSFVYVTWNDERMGSVYIRDFGTPHPPRKLTPEPGIYRTPSYSPDGRYIVFQKDPGNSDLGFMHSKNPGIYIVPADGSEAPQFIHRGGRNPVFSADGERIFYETSMGMNSSYRSIKTDGTDERTLFRSTFAKDYTPSPDNQWMAFRELHHVYITPFPRTGKTIELNKDIKSVPIARVSHDAGRYLHWSADSDKLNWVLGNEYFTAPLITRFAFLDGAPDSLPPIDTAGIRIGLRLQADVPQGIVALTNARIITMNNDEEVIESGNVIIEGNKILSVGPADETPIPRGAHIIDCTGKTIMPGLIDVHAHMFTFRLGLSPQKQWSYWANLAYGVTTTHDPSVETEMTFTQAEMVRAGIMTGPRIFSTGRILYGADGDFKSVINNLDDARSALRRTKAYGPFSVKSYNQPRRDQRQQVIQAAREFEILVYPEGGSFFYHNMTMVVDGHTGVEHNLPVAPLYDDVIRLWSHTETGNTPTLIVNYGSVTGEYYWYQHTDVWEKERLYRFMPRPLLDSRARHRTMIPYEEYENGHILTSQSCKKLLDAGVKINLGSHGQLQGLGAHWELWMLHQGGMTNMEALRAATMNGAWYIGMDDQIGSLETGKLADLIVLDGNPLEDIRQTEHVRYTMINGRIYEAETMREIGNYDREPGKFYWEVEGSGNAWPLHMHGDGFMLPKCLCRM